MTPRAFSAFAFLVVVGCFPSPDGDPALPTTQKCSKDPEVPTGGMSLLVGLGGTGTFKPLTAGAELPLQRGPQGGTHVYIDVLFRAEVAGTYKIASHLVRPDGGHESDTTVLPACVGWNRVDNVRFVLSRGAGEGDLDVKVGPVDDASTAIELSSTPVTVSVR